MPRLIWVFAGRTCHFVGFVMRRLILPDSRIQTVIGGYTENYVDTIYIPSPKWNPDHKWVQELNDLGTYHYPHSQMTRLFCCPWTRLVCGHYHRPPDLQVATLSLWLADSYCCCHHVLQKNNYTCTIKIQIFGLPKNYSNYPKIWTMWLYHRVISPRMANCVDPIRLIL